MALILTGPVQLVAGNDRRFLVTTTDTTLAAWVAAALTIRADPNYNRIYPVQELEDVDLSEWAMVLQVTNFTRLTSATYTFTATRAQMALLPVGRRRCVVDVWRTDAGNYYADVKPTWVDVVSPVYPLP